MTAGNSAARRWSRRPGGWWARRAAGCRPRRRGCGQVPPGAADRRRDSSTVGRAPGRAAPGWTRYVPPQPRPRSHQLRPDGPRPWCTCPWHGRVPRRWPSPWSVPGRAYGPADGPAHGPGGSGPEPGCPCPGRVDPAAGSPTYRCVVPYPTSGDLHRQGCG